MSAAASSKTAKPAGSKTTRPKAATAGPTKTKPANPILAAAASVPRRTPPPPIDRALKLEFSKQRVKNTPEFQPLRGDVQQMTTLVMRSLLVDIFGEEIVNHDKPMIPALKVSTKRDCTPSPQDRAEALEGMAITMSLVEITRKALVIVMPQVAMNQLWKSWKQTPDHPQIVLARFREGYLVSLTEDQKALIKVLLKGIAEKGEKLKESARKSLISVVQDFFAEKDPTSRMVNLTLKRLGDALDMTA